MADRLGKDKVDVDIEHEHTNIVQQMLLDDFGTYTTSNGQEHETLAEARVTQRILNENR